MIVRCIYCYEEKENGRDYKTNFCDSCVKDKEVGIPYLKETVFLKNYKKPVSKARLSELNSQTHIAGKNGDYDIGRKLKSGKVVEKSPDPSN
jgi:hypothetical protein